MQRQSKQTEEVEHHNEEIQEEDLRSIGIRNFS